MHNLSKAGAGRGKAGTAVGNHAGRASSRYEVGAQPYFGGRLVPAVDIFMCSQPMSRWR